MLPGRDQIGRVAAIKLERMTEFALEYPAGFVGIRKKSPPRIIMLSWQPQATEIREKTRRGNHRRLACRMEIRLGLFGRAPLARLWGRIGTKDALARFTPRSRRRRGYQDRTR